MPRRLVDSAFRDIEHLLDYHAKHLSDEEYSAFLDRLSADLSERRRLLISANLGFGVRTVEEEG